MSVNTTAYSQGLDARYDDDAEGTLTNCPYHHDTVAARDWYAGYNEDPAEMAKDYAESERALRPWRYIVSK